jgi:hypothetical protein
MGAPGNLKPPDRIRLLTVAIVFRLGGDVAESERGGSCDEQNLHHEIVQSFQEDRAEGLCDLIFTFVVSKSGGTLNEVDSAETVLQVRFELLGKSLGT